MTNDHSESVPTTVDTPAPADPSAVANIPSTVENVPDSISLDSSYTAAVSQDFGNYVLLEKLGEGGMGVVYKARQKKPERLVALKMIRAGSLAAGQEVRRFREEADQVALLDHPNIVPLFDFGEVNGNTYFSMKLIEGGTLQAHLGRFQRDPVAAARMLAQIARAVHHAHQRQLIHRDLKPGNILLDPMLQPHVADFGLAKRLSGSGEASRSGLVGTPVYMAPEQAQGRPLTTAADVYALGAILYALLTGRPPFEADHLAELFRLLQQVEPVPPRQLNPVVPLDLETICLKCLQKEAPARYGSAEALADDLDRWLRDEPVLARPVGRLERGIKWVRRNRQLASLLAALFLVLLVGTIVSTLLYLQSSANYDIASQRKDDVEHLNTELENKNATLRETLARSLLRPIRHDLNANALDDPEAAALMDLGARADELGLLFIQTALESPQTSRQLRRRADLALHAVTGLSSRRRQAVEELLLARLREPATPADLKSDCAFISSALDSPTPELITLALPFLLQDTRAPTKPRPKRPSLPGPFGDNDLPFNDDTLFDEQAVNLERERSAALDALKPYLAASQQSEAFSVEGTLQREGERAAQLVSRLLTAYRSNRSGSPYSGELLRRLAQRLTPQESAALVKEALDIVGTPRGTFDNLNPGPLVEFVQAASRRMEKQARAELAVRLTEMLAQPLAPMTLEDLGRYLLELCGELPQETRARLAETNVERLFRQLRFARSPFQGQAIAREMAQFASYLESKLLATFAEQALDLMRGQDLPSGANAPLGAMAVAALASRLPEAERARLARTAVTITEKGLQQANDPRVVYTFASALGISLGGLPAAERSAPAAEASKRLLDELARVSDIQGRNALVSATLQLLLPIRSAELHDSVRKLAQLIVGAVVSGKAQFADAGFEFLVPLLDQATVDECVRLILPSLAQAESPLDGKWQLLSMLAPRMRDEDAQKTLLQAERASVVGDGPMTLTGCVRTLAAVLPRVQPAEASARADRAAQSILAALVARTDDLSPSTLAGLLRDVAPFLSEQQSIDCGRQLLALYGRSIRSGNHDNFARAAASLLDRLPPQDGEALVRATILVVSRIATGQDAFSTSQVVQPMLRRATTQDCAGKAGLLAGGLLAPPMARLALLGAMHSAAPPRFTLQQLLDFLNLPLCSHSVRRILLDQLGLQLDQTFVDKEDMVRWVRERRPDLKLPTR